MNDIFCTAYIITESTVIINCIRQHVLCGFSQRATAWPLTTHMSFIKELLVMFSRALVFFELLVAHHNLDVEPMSTLFNLLIPTLFDRLIRSPFA